MKVVCAWCGCVIVEGTSEHISHGICLECSLREFYNKEV
jgi:hypothetical protein